MTEKSQVKFKFEISQYQDILILRCLKGRDISLKYLVGSGLVPSAHLAHSQVLEPPLPVHLIYKAFLNNVLGLELTLQERRAVETMLRTHVQYLQEQVSAISPSTSSQSSKTEELLRQRVENLLEALDNVIRNSEARNKQSKELIDDLKKANR